MNIEFKRLEEIKKDLIITLMNNPLVAREMPLLKEGFSDEDCDRFITAKAKMWKEYGYGSWAFVVDNQFAGWGGVQPNEGEADLALVLHPDFWGLGKVLYQRIVDKAFGEMGIHSIQVLFPPTRTRVKGVVTTGVQKRSNNHGWC